MRTGPACSPRSKRAHEGWSRLLPAPGPQTCPSSTPTTTAAAGTETDPESSSERSPARDTIARIRPKPGDYRILKPRYSAFVGTPLQLLLGELETSRILLCGTATEMCVAQTAISARELGFKVTVLAAACACVDEGDERLVLDYLERIVGCRIAASAVVGEEAAT
jgi:nicotinamidase-related amidase